MVGEQSKWGSGQDKDKQVEEVKKLSVHRNATASLLFYKVVRKHHEK